MADKPNFLLGYGERLTEPVPAPARGPIGKPPYLFEEARDRLTPLAEATASEFDLLPEAACPNNEAVAILTLHPQALSKSAYPGKLLKAVGLETIGSRPSRVKPEKWTRNGDPSESESTSLFVAGNRNSFRAWASEIGSWKERNPGADDLPKLEVIRACRSEDRLCDIPEEQKEPLLEIALHAGFHDNDVIEAFEAYATELGMTPDFDRRLYAGQLCFLPMRGVRSQMNELGKFAFLRVARVMPSLRPIGPVTRSVTRSTPFQCKLPDSDPVDNDLRAAVFDGGVPSNSSLSRWVTPHDAGMVGAPVDNYLKHGSNVSSALLFGPIEEGEPIKKPFGYIDHFRVLDENSGRDLDLFDVLIRIRDSLQSNSHQFINMSIGPEIPIEDDEVHTWTSVLDDLLSDGDRLAIVAAGNGGTRDTTLRYDRVQVPSDCVNAMAIGASDSTGTDWNRAPYSSIGPGRSPGLVKPDAIAFGGTDENPFHFVDATDATKSDRGSGTSFAAPFALRMAMGIRAHFGDRLTPLAIKALLVHATKDNDFDRREVGWGRLPTDLESFVVCNDGSIRIVYQGELTPGRYLKAPIPLPTEELKGKVSIKSTLCYATPIDAAHPGNYTRAGMDIVFFPHDQKFNQNSKSPDKLQSKPFFQLKEFSVEQDLRHQAHMWETTLHRENKSMLGKSLSNPHFTIHYNAREGGAPTRAADKVQYALVVSVSSKQTKDLYNQIVRRYSTQIQPLTPMVQIPIRAEL